MNVRNGLFCGFWIETVLLASIAGLLSGCGATRVMAEDLSLAERFELVALRNNAGEPRDALLKQTRPIRVAIRGDAAHASDVEAHVALLHRITGLDAEIVDFYDLPAPNMTVTFADRSELQPLVDAMTREEFGRSTGQMINCWATLFGQADYFRAEVYIRSDIPSPQIRFCIAQEMTQALGPAGDLDGDFGSRDDTVFVSRKIGPETLTSADIDVIRILYDSRLRAGMSRAEVLAILPEIIDDLDVEG